MSAPTKGPLEGVRILDVTIYQNGPSATAMLADMGADVIKVEEPVNGDPGRVAVVSGEDPDSSIKTVFETCNRNKRAITLDLKKSQGREVFYRLVKSADVVAQNFRVGVAKRLGIDYQTLKQHNPRIIFGSNTGLGGKGPDAATGTYDITAQARGGFMELLRNPKYPTYPPPYLGSIALVDQVGAMMFAHGIVLALCARDRHGIGQEVEVSQLGSGLMMQALGVQTYLFTGRQPPYVQREDYKNPLYNVFKDGTGRWFALGGLPDDRYWPTICRIFRLEHLMEDPRFATRFDRAKNSAELVRIFDKLFETKPYTHWIEIMRNHDVPCALVQNYAEVAQDRQVIENEYIVDFTHPVVGPIKVLGVPIKLSETPGSVRTAAPEFGQHTEEVLLEHGYTWGEVEQLRTEGVI